MKQNSPFARIDGMFSIGGERLVALRRVGHVGVEQRQVELHVQRFFVELARQVHPRFGRVDVLVQVEHQVVRRRSCRRWRRRPPGAGSRWRSASDIFASGPTSSRSRPLRPSRCSGWRRGTSRRTADSAIGRSVRSEPGSRRRVGRSLAGFARLGVLEGAARPASAPSRQSRSAGGQSASIRGRRGESRFGVDRRLAYGVSTVVLAMRVAGRERR